MPRFYFDVREGGSSTRDTDGLEFNSLNAAEYEAARLRPRSGGEMPHPGDKGVHEAVIEKAKALIDEHIRSKDAFHQALN